MKRPTDPVGFVDYVMPLDRLIKKLKKASSPGKMNNIGQVKLKAEEILFHQGDRENSIYIVIDGILGVRATRPDGSKVILNKLNSGGIIGDLTFLTRQKRTATVFAKSKAHLICLNRSYFDQLSKVEQNLLINPEKAVKRWRRQQLVDGLRNIFGDISMTDLHRWQDQMDWLHLSAGNIVFQQGASPDGMYIIITGRIRFVRSIHGNDDKTISCEIGPGQPFGDFGLLTGEPRVATVKTIRTTDLVRISLPLFNDMICKYPAAMVRMAKINALRDSTTTNQKSVAPDTLTIAISAHDPSVDAWAFTNNLCDALSKIGSSVALNHDRFQTYFDQKITLDTINTPSVVSAFSQMEATVNYVLLVTDVPDSAWTRCCLNQADQVLIVADSKNNPAPGSFEQYLNSKDIKLRTELVLLHEPSTKEPEGTAAWLLPRNLSAHYHVREGEQAHIHRIARRLTGHAIALVLSGGGARGFAHMGVQRAMEELDIPIDYIGCSSMGAVLGGLISYCTHEKMMDMAKVEFANSKVLFDYTLPFVSIMASHNVTQMMRRIYKERMIEDLWYPFFCVTSNITTAEPVVIQTGPLWRAVRSSLAIPGVFTPVMEKGDVLVDGGILNNFPVRLTADLSRSEYIIGVHVGLQKGKKRDYHFDTSISGWKILLNRMNPFSRRIKAPTLIGIVMRTMEANSLRDSREQAKLTDVMIEPDVKKFSINNYGAFDAIANEGYNAAIAPLKEWKKKCWPFY